MSGNLGEDPGYLGFEFFVRQATDARQWAGGEAAAREVSGCLELLANLN